MARCLVFNPFWRNFTLTLDQGRRNLGHWMHLIELYLVPSMKSVGEIASRYGQLFRFFFFNLFWENLILTLTFGHWMHRIKLYLGTKYEVCRWNNLQDMTSSLVYTHFRENLPFTLGQGHRHLGHLMCLIGFYLGTKYEVCRWNSIRDMASFLFNFLPILEKFDLDLCPWP